MWNNSLIAWQRLNSLVLLVLSVKGVVYPPLWYTLVLWVWGLPYLFIVTPFGLLMVLYLLLGHSALIACTFGMMTFISWFLFLYDHLTIVPYCKSIELYCFYFHMTIWPLYPILSSLNFILYLWLVKLLKARSCWGIFLEGLSRL